MYLYRLSLVYRVWCWYTLIYNHTYLFLLHHRFIEANKVGRTSKIRLSWGRQALYLLRGLNQEIGHFIFSVCFYWLITSWYWKYYWKQWSNNICLWIWLVFTDLKKLRSVVQSLSYFILLSVLVFDLVHFLQDTLQLRTYQKKRR